MKPLSLQEIAAKTDLTHLKVDNNYTAVTKLINDAILIKPASVCIYPSMVKLAKKLLFQNNYYIPICTVVNFPHGNSAPESYIADINNCIANGVDEIDIVLPFTNYLSDKEEFAKDLPFLKKCSAICKDNNVILKVIVETGVTANECVAEDLENLYKLCQDIGADFIKTSTGFGPCGAREMDIVVWNRARRKDKNNPLLIKASGGIATVDDAILMIQSGADRLGIGSAYTNIFSELL